MDTVVQRLISVVKEFPDNTAQLSKDSKGVFQKTSYRELLEEVKYTAAGLKSFGVTRGEAVGCISDNRKEWALCDFALLSLGSFNVPRGCDIMAGPMARILSIPQCKITILENELQLKKVLEVRDDLPALEKIILLDEPKSDSTVLNEAAGYTLITFSEILEQGEKIALENPGFFDEEVAKGSSDDLSTIIFTSGTTGEPKGVMLTNASFVLQSKGMQRNIPIKRDEVWMTILPIWHSFERSISYIGFLNGNTIAYSKPLGSQLLSDLKTVQPSIMSAVPRVWEAIYSGIMRNIKKKGKTAEKLFNFFIAVGTKQEWLKRQMLGRNFQFKKPVPFVKHIVFIIPYLLLVPLRKIGDVLFFSKIKNLMFPNWYTGISGGGALPAKVDHFYSALGLLVIDGYGLTEAGPFVSGRETFNPVSGGVGVPIDGIEIKVVDVDNDDAPVKVGERGILMVKGGSLMKGYYNNPKLTSQVLRNGWLDTGDVVVVDRRDNISIVGRAKDTLVLLSGENIEPFPIEKKLCESSYIDYAVVLGDDCKSLSALIVPNFENLKEFAEENNLTNFEQTSPGDIPEIYQLINGEISRLVSAKNQFAPFERIFKFSVLKESFEVGRELSAKMELLRPTVYKLYKEEIESLTS